MRSPSSLATILLTNHLTESSVRPFDVSDFWNLVRTFHDPGALIGMETSEIADRLSGDVSTAETVSARLETATLLAFELEQLEQTGLKVITVFDDEYPAAWSQRLGHGAPPVIYVAGTMESFATDGLGIVGSRNVSPEAAAAAREAARLAAGKEIPVISGGAKGTDLIAMQGAHEAGGQVVGILADSLSRALKDSSMRRHVADGTLTLLTPFSPAAGFNVGNAMSRNKLIYASSKTTFVAAADLEKGGSWAGAVEAIRKDYSAVAVWMGAGAGSGNGALVRKGAIPITKLEELFTEDSRPALSEQLGLGI